MKQLITTADDFIKVDNVRRFANISSCGRYRWSLSRVWDDDLPPLILGMLNPSTADGLLDDATIRVCMGRARLMDCGGLVVFNEFAYRATDPADMMTADDPVGPENDQQIRNILAIDAKMVIVAWGAHGGYRNRANIVLDMIRGAGVTPYCLGKTKEGYPKHPLRISYSVTPIPYYPTRN